MQIPQYLEASFVKYLDYLFEISHGDTENLAKYIKEFTPKDCRGLAVSKDVGENGPTRRYDICGYGS